MADLCMTDEIRRIIKKRMIDLELSQTELAQRLKVSNQSLSRALSTTNKDRQQISDMWQGILREIGCKLTIEPIAGEEPNG